MYSVQKSELTDSADLWTADHKQIVEMNEKDPYHNAFVTNKYVLNALYEKDIRCK